MIFVIEALLKEGKLPAKFRDHKLIWVSKNIKEYHNCSRLVVDLQDFCWMPRTYPYRYT